MITITCLIGVTLSAFLVKAAPAPVGGTVEAAIRALTSTQPAANPANRPRWCANAPNIGNLRCRVLDGARHYDRTGDTRVASL